MIKHKRRLKKVESSFYCYLNLTGLVDTQKRPYAMGLLEAKIIFAVATR